MYNTFMFFIEAMISMVQTFTDGLGFLWKLSQLENDH